MSAVFATTRALQKRDQAAAERPFSHSSLDRFGGSTRLHCANKSGHFILTKIGHRWWFCDPDGNVFVSMSVGAIVPSRGKDCDGVDISGIYAAKYGDATFNWGWQTLKRMTAWGFNSVGQDSGAYVQANSGCSKCPWPGGRQPIPLPYLTELKPAEYASINRLGYLSEPIKDEISGTNDRYNSWRGGALYDAFDPKLSTEWQKELANRNHADIRSNSPYILGIFSDDSDFFFGSGAGPDYPTGHTNSNIGWITLITSPVQTYTQSTPLAGEKFLYRTSQNFTKTQATNPSTPCSISNPCSLRDYLWQKYNGSIAALNKAWGSNYTTFDSTGTQVNGELLGTGDGNTRTFTRTLAHAHVSPYSVLISVAGTAEVGDCPWFHSGCSASSSNTGTLGSPTASLVAQSASTINYSNGAVTITFNSAPAKGAAISASYIYGGWMAGGTGLMDEDGSHTAWVGTNPFCLEGPDPNYPTYFSCVGGAGPNNPIPNASAALGADLDNWISQFAAQYFKTMHDDLKAVSQLPYLGLDVFGSWGGPAYSKFMEGAAPYLDGAYTNIKYWMPSPSPAIFQSSYQYITRYMGDLPLLNFAGIYAQADSSMSCHSDAGDPNSLPNQNIRGQMWYNMVNYLLTTPGYNGDTQFVGFDFWSWQDFQNLNQGLVSLHDNAYDGHEDVVAKILCSNPLQNFTCGGESANYGDAITHISKANALWYRFLPEKK